MRLVATFISISLFATSVWGHGEDKPGPNDGFIRMPGAFHTEIVPISKNQLKVFLLDIYWKNPSVKDSALHLMYQGETKITAVCEIKESLYYLCSFPKSIDLTKKGEIVVEAQRESQKGNLVTYELPLKLKKIDDGHSGH